jgi:hypothetical protein
MSIVSARGDARVMQPWSHADDNKLRQLWNAHGGSFEEIAGKMGRTKGSISGRSRRLGLQFHGGRAIVLEDDSPALIEMRSIFKSRVVDPPVSKYDVIDPRALRVLKWGDNQRKLGGVVTRGPWKHFPIYSLTLEERATCPETCKLLSSCYGNNMGHAKRYRHGDLLLVALADDLDRLSWAHPGGFVVRLHILGDFWSLDYVKFWRIALETFPALYVFGYTAWGVHTQIGKAVRLLRDRHWGRFAVRTSGAKYGPRTLVVADNNAIPMPLKSDDAIPCPAQTGKTKNCGTCGLCWSPTVKDRAIAFRQH